MSRPLLQVQWKRLQKHGAAADPIALEATAGLRHRIAVHAEILKKNTGASSFGLRPT